MRIFLVIFGWYMVIAGVLLVIKPTVIKQLAGTWLRAGRVNRPIAILPLIVGLAMWWAAPSSQIPALIRLIAILSVGKGVYFLIAPQKQASSFINWWLKLPMPSYVVWGLVATLCGIAVLVTL